MRMLAAPSLRPLQLVLLGQGLFYILTGVWPLVHLDSFLWVTGDKDDIFLLRTVAVLVTVIGLVLFVEGFRSRPSAAVVLLGVGAALALAGVEVWHIRSIRWVYLLDAFLEVGIAAALVLTWIGSRRFR